MIPGVNPRQMQQMMQKMGMQQTDIPAEQVIIRTKDKDIVIQNPQVAKVTMMGQQTFQISGHVVEQKRVTTYTPSDEDVQTVVSQAGTSAQKAREALVQSGGDIAQAILKLTE